MSKLYSSLLRATKHNEPWEYFTFGQCLTPQQIDIINAEIFNEYYGTPSSQGVLGPLGTAFGGLTGAGPGLGTGSG